MYTPERIPLTALAALLLPLLASAAPAGPGLGKPASPAEVAAWSLNVFPDGRGLPTGSGDAVAGKAVYDQRCAACHGPEGRGGSAGELADGKHGLTGPDPDKTIGNYWPYATTLFDFVRRSMPLDEPGSLSNDQIYAVCAYLLYRNGLIGERERLDAASLAGLKMPNREGFIPIDVE